MFYAHYVLSKKGPLAKVWLAAHWDKKLTRAHVFETDVEKTVDNIISPKIKMALRTSGHLLLGVVRIYSRKQKYLIQDLGEACAKIKMAFRPGVVDLPMEAAGNTDTITLPEIFHDLENAVADLNDVEEQVVMHRSRAEDITIKENLYINSGSRGYTIDDEYPWDDNPFGGMLQDIHVSDLELERINAGGPEDSHDNLDKSTNSLSNKQDNIKGTDLMQVDQGGLEGNDFMGGFGDDGLQEGLLNIPGLDEVNVDGKRPFLPPEQEEPMEHQPSDGGEDQNQGVEQRGPEEEDVPLIPVNNTLKEGDGFTLEPLDASYRMRQKRKRKLVIDSRKELLGKTIRAQLMDCSDILQPKLVPPPSKKALQWKEFGTAEHLLHNPTMPFMAIEIAGLVCSNLTYLPEEDDEMDGDEESRIEDRRVDEDEAGKIDRASSINDPSIQGSPKPFIPPDNGLLGNDNMQIDDFGGNGDQMHGDFIDYIDQEGGGLDPPPSKRIPEMPDLGEDDEKEEEEEAATNGTQLNTEQGLGDKTDELEKRRWNKRSQDVLKTLEKSFKRSDELQFSSLTNRKSSRKVAASNFYTCLLLAKEGTVKFKQDKPYAPITITKGTHYTQPSVP